MQNTSKRSEEDLGTSAERGRAEGIAALKRAIAGEVRNIDYHSNKLAEAQTLHKALTAALAALP